MILETVAQAQERTAQPTEQVLAQLELATATYYRWRERQAADRLEDRVVVPRRALLLPTPEEVLAVRGFALDHPATGYKRLTWMMIDEDVAYLRAYQVYRILVAQNLLARRPTPPTETLRRPAAADHPDQRWHVDGRPFGRLVNTSEGCAPSPGMGLLTLAS